MDKHFYITSMISSLDWSETERKNIAGFLQQMITDVNQQQSFFDYCKQWKLGPWVCVQLQRNELMGLFAHEIQSQFTGLHLQIKTENEKRNAEACRFLKAFRENGIDVIILKGNLLAHTVYLDSGYKRMNDFDILIRQADWPKIQEIYFSLGYIPLGFGWSGEKQKAAKFSHVGMSFISPDFSCIIGTQWGLKSPTAGYSVNIEEAWDTSLSFDFSGVLVRQLSASYNLLHLVLHMGIYKCGIRDCMDVYNLFTSAKPNEAELLKLFESTGATEKAAFTFTLAALSCPALQPFADRIHSGGHGFISRRLAKRLLAFEKSGDLHLSYNDYFQDIEKEVIYFNIFPEFHKKLIFYFRILKKIWWPKTSIALKLADRPEDKNIFPVVSARIKAPYYVFSLIAQEIGWSFTVLLFIKLAFDLAWSFKNYFLKKESYFDYLKKRGVDPKAIEKAVKNIQ